MTTAPHSSSLPAERGESAEDRAQMEQVHLTAMLHQVVDHHRNNERANTALAVDTPSGRRSVRIQATDLAGEFTLSLKPAIILPASVEGALRGVMAEIVTNYLKASRSRFDVHGGVIVCRYSIAPKADYR
jgi:hypothetical protein